MEGTVEGRFQIIFQKCKNSDYSSYKPEELLGLIHEIEELLNSIAQEGLFSKNEELDDVLTESLKFLFVQYYHGKALISVQDLDHRIDNLNAGKSSLLRFIDTCKSYRLLHETEVAKIDENRRKPLNAEEKRVYKIEKFKREKVAKKRIQELTRFLAIVKKDEVEGDDHEEEQRELYTLTLQSYARDALDEIDMLEEELVMLKMRHQTMNPVDEHGNPKPNNHDPRTAAPLPPPENRPGLSITKTFKVGDQLMMSRETVKATIFGPGIAPPTMSLEEFADLEREAAEARAKNQADAPKGPRKYNQLELDGDEDDMDLADDAIMEDRKWDDWKDNNPRGWGNKMGKRY